MWYDYENLEKSHGKCELIIDFNLFVVTFREQRFRNECQGNVHMLSYSCGPIFVSFIGLCIYS